MYILLIFYYCPFILSLSLLPSPHLSHSFSDLPHGASKIGKNWKKMNFYKYTVGNRWIFWNITSRKYKFLKMSLLERNIKGKYLNKLRALCMYVLINKTIIIQELLLLLLFEKKWNFHWWNFTNIKLLHHWAYSFEKS